MLRTDIINQLIKRFGYTKYLELGVQNNSRNWTKIEGLQRRDGVDPKSGGNHRMTSDKFFAQLDPDFKYDIIFIDGLHLEEQVDKDVENSLNHLVEGGTLVMHDCSPPTLWHQRPLEEFKGNEQWNGTVWRSFAKLRMTRDDLSMWCVDTDWGVGIIRRGSQDVFPKPSELTYELLEQNRKELLNLISPEEFTELIKTDMK